MAVKSEYSAPQHISRLNNRELEILGFNNNETNTINNFYLKTAGDEVQKARENNTRAVERVIN